MRRKKILVCLLFFLVYILAAQMGLMDYLPAIALFSPGNWLFPETSHAWGLPDLLSLLIDIVFYGIIVYGVISVVFWLLRRGKSASSW